MSVFSASPQCFSLARDGEIFQVPLFHFFSFGSYILWASLLCLSHLPLSSSSYSFSFGFFWGKISASLWFVFYLLTLSLAAIFIILKLLLSC